MQPVRGTQEDESLVWHSGVNWEVIPLIMRYNIHLVWVWWLIIIVSHSQEFSVPSLLQQHTKIYILGDIRTLLVQFYSNISTELLLKSRNSQAIGVDISYIITMFYYNAVNDKIA